PHGRPKAEQQFKTVNRIVQDVLLKEVKGLIGGKRQTMLALEAGVAKQMAKALDCDTRAAKLVLDRADKHVASHQTLAAIPRSKPVFTFTEEERRRFSSKKLLEGVVFDQHNDSPKDNDHEGQLL